MNSYENITERIVEGLKRDGLKWFKPWVTSMGAPPVNHVTGKPYQGINTLLLSVEAEAKNYAHSEWGTFKQFKSVGANVRKGEKSTPCYFMALSYKDPKGKWHLNEASVKKAGFDLSECNKVFTLRQFALFNIAQVEGAMPKTKAKKVEEGEFTAIATAEEVYANYPKAVRPTLTHGGDVAAYSPASHTVMMPKAEKFVTPEAYYKTLFHELVHSSGAEKCLNRKGVTDPVKFGSHNYAQEELVAEIGALFLCEATGVKADFDHSQAYINDWADRLTRDPKVAYFAAKQAIDATNFILNKS